MKEYYIFNVKDEFLKLYRDKPSELFFIFNRINNLRLIDKKYGYDLFSQISMFYNKKKINNFIKNIFDEKIIYSTTEDEHIINNLFLNEISILNVNYSNIKIKF